MIEANLECLRAHKDNIARYRRLLATQLSDLEREYIERRLAEEQAALRTLLHKTFPERLTARLPRIEKRATRLEMAALLHPSGAFNHPTDVLDDCDLTSYEKRAILSSWAAEACAAHEPTPVSFDDVLDALRLLESETDPPVDPGLGSTRQSGGRKSDNLPFDF